MSLLSEIATLHLNAFYVIAPIFIGISLVIYTLVLATNFTRNRTDKVIQSNGPHLLVTAHPDDECMFFAPSLLRLVKHNPQSVHLLCVTTGDYYKKGAIRRKEIYKSCEILGIPARNIKVLDNSAFLDGNESWDFQKLLPEISSYVRAVHPKYIFTFDDKGVSGHPNHISLSKALRLLLAQDRAKEEIPVLMELKTIPIYRKYISFLDILPTIANSEIVFVSPISEILQAQRAMCSHASQFVWFRALYIVFSRYMMINDYTEVSL